MRKKISSLNQLMVEFIRRNTLKLLHPTRAIEFEKASYAKPRKQ
jgi:hypothetical protein